MQEAHDTLTGIYHRLGPGSRVEVARDELDILALAFSNAAQALEARNGQAVQVVVPVSPVPAPVPSYRQSVPARPNPLALDASPKLVPAQQLAVLAMIARRIVECAEVKGVPLGVAAELKTIAVELEVMRDFEEERRRRAGA